MTENDIIELEFLWEFFKTPRSLSERNKELLKRLKKLVTMKLLEETNNG